MNKLCEKIEDLDGYHGLYGEVVEADIYRIKSLDFQPDVVFDFGANVGIFARFARTLFPDALIVCVEPNPINCDNFRRFTSDPKIKLIQKAIGKGQVYHYPDAINGSHECYITRATGYEDIANASVPADPVQAVLPGELIKQIMSEQMRGVCKMDIEGGENAVWDDPESMHQLRRMDFFTAEVHRYALIPDGLNPVNDVTEVALRSFEPTHLCCREHVHFYARKHV